MKINRPSVVGRYTNDIVYERLAPGILKELKSRNPKNETGNRPAKHHQWLTQDVGHPALAQHLHATIALMRASATWEHFYRLLQRALPKKNETIPLALKDTGAPNVQPSYPATRPFVKRPPASRCAGNTYNYRQARDDDDPRPLV